jgi:hypothetical protein
MAFEFCCAVGEGALRPHNLNPAAPAIVNLGFMVLPCSISSVSAQIGAIGRAFADIAIGCESDELALKCVDSS